MEIDPKYRNKKCIFAYNILKLKFFFFFFFENLLKLKFDTTLFAGKSVKNSYIVKEFSYLVVLISAKESSYLLSLSNIRQCIKYR